MAPPSKRACPGRGSGVQPLPFDALYDILLRLQAKALCRFRAVCRPWRSLLSDPGFISAHEARHPGPPLIVAGYDPSDRSGILCDIVDLSGRVVRRVHSLGPGTAMERVVSADLGFIQIVTEKSMSCQLLNLATGALFSLPESLGEEHAARVTRKRNYRSIIRFGKVPSTGEYKVLRVLGGKYSDDPLALLLCEVFTLDGSNNSRWRATKASLDTICWDYFSSVVINGIVYFLCRDIFADHVSQKRIASFDLETEEWRPDLLGPLISLMGIGRHYGRCYGDLNPNCFSLAALNECLVLVHCCRYSFINLWFLMDLEKCVWVKQHSIEIDPVAPGSVVTHPLVVLNDGRIVIHCTERGVLRVWDPRTSACTHLATIRTHCGIGLYTGSVLSVGNSARTKTFTDVAEIKRFGEVGLYTGGVVQTWQR